MRILTGILKLLGIIFLLLIVLAAALLIIARFKQFVPRGYESRVKAGGPIEAKYLSRGTYEVGSIEAEAPGDWEKFVIYYPEDAEAGKCPAVIFVNGTGVRADKYGALFRHLASWGFVVAGNNDPGTFSGNSADATLEYLLGLNEAPGSALYQRVDTGRIGISGHSQGGVGVFNAVNTQPHGYMYSCAVSLSPTERPLAEALGIPYDPALTSIPTLILAGTNNDVISPEGVKELTDTVVTPQKAAALRLGAGHGEMLYCGDGYVTAWFMYWLRGDEDAGRAFFGADPELAGNPLWDSVEI